MPIKIKTEGFAQAEKKLKPENLLAPVMTELMAEAAEAVKKAALRRAPKDTGKLADSIKGKVVGKKSKFGVVSVNRAKKGFKIAQALEFSKGRYRYRKGSKRGQPTTGWFTGSLDEAKGQVMAALERAAKDIEKRFGR